nr:LINE-type retrotransposon LIb DNA [Ipomoea batatas]
MSQRLHPAIISGGFHRRQLLCPWLDLRLLASLPLTALSPPLRFSPSDLLRRPSASPTAWSLAHFGYLLDAFIVIQSSILLGLKFVKDKSAKLKQASKTDHCIGLSEGHWSSLLPVEDSQHVNSFANDRCVLTSKFPCSALALGVPPRLAVRHASLVRAKSFPSTGNGSGGHNQTKEVGCASIDIDVKSDNEMDTSDSADGIPLIKLQNELGKEMCQQWKSALIVKFLGKRISLSILLQRLPRMWGLQGKSTTNIVSHVDGMNVLVQDVGIPVEDTVIGNRVVTNRSRHSTSTKSNGHVDRGYVADGVKGESNGWLQTRDGEGVGKSFRPSDFDRLRKLNNLLKLKVELLEKSAFERIGSAAIHLDQIKKGDVALSVKSTICHAEIPAVQSLISALEVVIKSFLFAIPITLSLLTT